jgi:NADH:ubiquinone oxidoreductase subunit
MSVLKQMFTWWNSQTIGTRIFTWSNGNLVGEDSLGNSFYEDKDKKRRWVVFKGDIDASSISSDWHGWLHHTFVEIPTASRKEKKFWEKPHVINLTGTNKAYHPKNDSEKKYKNSYNDYEAWLPKSE